jgi:hypothetical protein
MHGMTKFVEYMILYGSAMNFYGGPGEANHNIFVKAAGLKLKEEYVSLLNRLHISIII